MLVIPAPRYETAFWSDRKVLHLELSIRGSGMAYEPGDAIGVLPTNPPDLVAGLCKRLNVSPDKVRLLGPRARARTVRYLHVRAVLSVVLFAHGASHSTLLCLDVSSDKVGAVRTHTCVPNLQARALLSLGTCTAPRPAPPCLATPTSTCSTHARSNHDLA